MSARSTNFKYISYLWDDAKAAGFAGDEVALPIFRSNLLGALTIAFLTRLQKPRPLILPYTDFYL